MSWTDADGRRALERMRERASCRGFLDKEIPGGLLDEIIDTGLCAASGGNLQPYSIVVIKDGEERARLAEVCGRQGFIEQAPVNLLFVLDWYKFSVFAGHENAPFTCPDSYMHFIIALEDVMCAAQMIETAAHLCGVWSCYVGTVNHAGKDLIAMYNLPKYTFPVILLSLGYPKSEPARAPKLDRGVMVFDERYKAMDDAFIADKFTQKYQNRVMKLPSDQESRDRLLESFNEALLTTFTPEQASGIVQKAKDDGQINETQRRFGLHYHASRMRSIGKDIISMMEENGLTFFTR